MAEHDAMLVECPSCGAPCSAANADTVTCAHCGASVDVGHAVRIFATHVDATQVGHVWTARLEQLRALREGLALPRDEEVEGPAAPSAEQRCPSCGKTLHYGEAPLEKCPHCGAESVPRLREGVEMSIAALRERAELRRQIREQMLEMFPLALEPLEGSGEWRCSRCEAPLESEGRDPFGKPRLKRCTKCFTQSYGSETQSTLAMYTAIASRLPGAAPEAAREAPRPVTGGQRLNIGLVLLVVFGGLLALRFALFPDAPPRSGSAGAVTLPELRMPPQIEPMPRFTIYPDAAPGECERLWSSRGECVGDGPAIARTCNDAGVVEDNRCFVLGMRCARDHCGEGARCCMISWSSLDASADR